MLTSELSFYHLEQNLEIVAAADACGNGIGAVILYKYENGSLKAVVHASPSLLLTEKS